ncbi:unnamed protein product [Prunus armeniaca]
MGKDASQKGDQHMAAYEFAQAAGNSLFDQATGYFGRCGISPSKWAQVLVLPSNPKLLLLGPSMGLVNARNHPYHNPLSKPQAFAWLWPT